MQKILLIDDSPFLTQMLAIQFHEKGFEPLVAGSGEEGINLAKKEIPNIILLDLAMPTLSGWDVLTALKQDEKTKRIPVIILTNDQGNEEIRQKALEAGAAELLHKNELSVEEILKAVPNYL